MSHPQNKRERFLIGKHKGKLRAEGYWRGVDTQHEEPGWMEWNCQLRRDTTKLCSCYMCGNERRHFGLKTFQERKHNEIDCSS